jgi:hypothetical protein
MQNESLLLILPGVGILALCLVVVIYRTGTKETTANTHEEDNPLFNVSRSTSSASLGEEAGRGSAGYDADSDRSSIISNKSEEDPYAFNGGSRRHRKNNKGSKGRKASKGSKGRKSRKHNNKKSKSKNSKSF